MSDNETATAVKEVNHFDEAMDFGRDYLAKEFRLEDYSETEYEDGYEIGKRVKLNIFRLVSEMHRARGVIDTAEDWLGFLAETAGFEIAIQMHMHEKCYHGNKAEFLLYD